MARAVIELGNTLGLMTVADGIERADQLGMLRGMGCFAGQGFYLSRPLPAAGVDRLLAESEGDAGPQLRSFRLDAVG